MNDQSMGIPSITPSIVEYQPVAAGLAELHRKYHGVVYDVRERAGMADATAARNELRKVRTSLEAKRKEIKAPALARAKAIDSEAKEIEDVIVSLERPIAQQIEAEAKRIENEKREREEAEMKRVAALMERVNQIKLTPARVTGKNSASIEAALGVLKATEIDASFAEFQKEAEGERAIAIATLTTMLAGAKAQEEEARKIADERAELERLRKERAEIEAKQEAERKARIEAEEQDAREQRAREDALAKAERDRLDAEAAARREEEAARAAEFTRSVGVADRSASSVLGGDTPTPYWILLAAMKSLQRIALPGSEEAAIVEKALFDVGEL